MTTIALLPSVQSIIATTRRHDRLPYDMAVCERVGRLRHRMDELRKVMRAAISEHDADIRGLHLERCAEHARVLECLAAELQLDLAQAGEQCSREIEQVNS